MKSQRARYAKIKSLTTNVLRRFGVGGPSVPIERILADSGISVRFGLLGDVSGLLSRTGEAAIVGVNSKHPKTRQRFTMAHEFGHFLLHQDLTSHSDTHFRVHFRDRNSSEATDVEEIEANFFAASILMPREFLDKTSAPEALGDDDLVAGLAKRFGVSGHAMSLRLVNEYGGSSPF